MNKESPKCGQFDKKDFVTVCEKCGWLSRRGFTENDAKMLFIQQVKQDKKGGPMNESSGTISKQKSFTGLLRSVQVSHYEC